MVHLGPKKPPSRKGSMNDVPRNLIDELHKYEAMLTVSPSKLKSITNHFVTELEKGLSVKGGNIPMIPTWIMDYPDGTESGDYIAIDLGGTNLRCCLVTLDGKRSFDISQSKYRVPHSLKISKNRDDLFEFIADCLDKFIKDSYPEGTPNSELLSLGFTFSYPASQNSIDQGVLQTWTKGWDIHGVEGEDVVPLLMKSLDAKKVPIKVVALINDTAGTLVASRYTDPKAELGLIFGTGCNGAYYDKVCNIPKLQGRLPSDIPQDSPMVINCEYGSFDNEHLALPRTKYDVLIDEQSPRPGQQAFEKMIAGFYLGEVLRLILVDLYEQGLVFETVKKDDEPYKLLFTPYALDTEFLAVIESDPFENLEETFEIFKKLLKIEPNIAERKLVRKLSELIGTRAARLSICGIAAVVTKMGLKECDAAADGSVFNKYPDFPQRAAQGLADIFGWDSDISKHPIKIVTAEDGSGVGAAIIAALTEKRLHKGLSVGLAA